MPDGIIFDKASYAPGDKITATITDSAAVKTQTATYATVFGNLSANFQISANGQVTDTGNHTWTVTKNADGTFTAVTTA